MRTMIIALLPILIAGPSHAGKSCYFQDAEGTCIDREMVEPIHLLKKGTPYAKVRRTLIAKGYVPGRAAGSAEARCSVGRDECRTYPETLACSGTGRAVCTFLYDKGDSHYRVHTFGEDALYAGASFISDQENAKISMNTVYSARSGMEHCLLEVDDKPYILGRCNVDRESDGSLSIGTGGRGVGAPYFAYVNLNDDGTATGSWNEEAGATHAHSDLGTLKQWGSCWMNGKAKICAWK